MDYCCIFVHEMVFVFEMYTVNYNQVIEFVDIVLLYEVVADVDDDLLHEEGLWLFLVFELLVLEFI
jgi:hypothetical protein